MHCRHEAPHQLAAFCPRAKVAGGDIWSRRKTAQKFGPFANFEMRHQTELFFKDAVLW